MNDFLAAALNYADHRIKVFPVRPRSKEPLTEHGHKDATTDESRIQEWWSKWPDANIGAPTGANGWTVLDIDTDSPGELLKIATRLGIETQVPMVRTGKGRHLFFAAASGLGPSARAAGEPVDIRSGESYVVLPPSVHRNGREYRWNVPLCDPLPVMPPATLGKLRSTAAKSPVAVGPNEADILEGERNNELARIAGSLRRVGATEGAILSQLRDVNAARCKPPLSDRELEAIAKSVVRYEPVREPVLEDGPQLFEDIKAGIREHYFFDREWHYTIASLYVLECAVFRSLPAVFYLFFPGSFGTGKTNILGLIAALTGSVSLENVSVSALAHELGDGKPVCIDEYDVSRGKEVDEVRDALVRNGYKRSAAPYTRHDPTTRKNYRIPVYGPKALTFRGSIETALQSRGYTIPTVKVRGRAGYALVKKNFWPHLGGLPDRIAEWGRISRTQFTPEVLETIASTPEFDADVESVVKELGATRSSELATVAVLIARIARLDVVADLREANALNELETASSETEDREDLLEILRNLTELQVREKGQLILEDAKIVRYRQREIFEALNRLREGRKEKPLTARAFAALRRDIGVREDWLAIGGHAKYWNLPMEWVRETLLQGSESTETSEPQLSEPRTENGPGEAILTVQGILRELNNRGRGANLEDVLRISGERGIAPDRARGVLKRMKTEGDLYEPVAGTFRLTESLP